MTGAWIGGSTVFAMMAFAVMVAAVSMVAMAAIVVIVRMATVVSVVVMVVGIVVSVRSAVRALATVRRAGYRPARVAMARRAHLIRGRLGRVARRRRRGRRPEHVGNQRRRQDDGQGQPHEFFQPCHVFASPTIRCVAWRLVARRRIVLGRTAERSPFPSLPARSQSARSRLEPRAS